MTDFWTHEQEAREQEARDLAKTLFGRTDDTEQTDETEDPAETTETDDEHKPPVGNYVPLEGNVPKTKDNSDAQFVRDLFSN